MRTGARPAREGHGRRRSPQDSGLAAGGEDTVTSGVAAGRLGEGAEGTEAVGVSCWKAGSRFRRGALCVCACVHVCSCVCV